MTGGNRFDSRSGWDVGPRKRTAETEANWSDSRTR
jgi:hypothetical protein